MPQLSKGDTFANGQQVTGPRLNQLVDSAQILVGAISEQQLIATNGVSSADEMLINDGGILKKTTVNSILNSGINITTGTINGNAGSDLILAPAAGQKVDINAAFEANSINCVGNETVGGTMTVTGVTNLNGAANANAGLTVTGTANIVGNLLINGSAIQSGFLGLIEESIPNFTGNNGAIQTLHTMFTTAAYTKPQGEVWIIETDFTLFMDTACQFHWRLGNASDSIDYISSFGVTTSNQDAISIYRRAVLPSNNTHSGSFLIRYKGTNVATTITPNSQQLIAGGTNLTSFPDNTRGCSGFFRITKFKAVV